MDKLTVSPAIRRAAGLGAPPIYRLLAPNARLPEVIWKVWKLLVGSLMLSTTRWRIPTAPLGTAYRMSCSNQKKIEGPRRRTPKQNDMSVQLAANETSHQTSKYRSSSIALWSCENKIELKAHLDQICYCHALFWDAKALTSWGRPSDTGTLVNEVRTAVPAPPRATALTYPFLISIPTTYESLASEMYIRTPSRANVRNRMDANTLQVKIKSEATLHVMLRIADPKPKTY